MIELRDYQQELASKILEAWAAGHTPLAVSPTGSGKTVIFSHLIAKHSGYSAVVAHRREILTQISLSLGTFEVKHRIVAPAKIIAEVRRQHFKKFNKSFVDSHSKVGVISVQTLTSKASQNKALLRQWLHKVTLCIFDEGHHYVKKGLWGRAVELLPQSKKLFVTATPERTDGLGLGIHAHGFSNVLIEGPPTKELIRRGYLSRFKYYTPETDLNVNNIPLTASGDVNLEELRKRTVASHLVGDVVQHQRQFATGKRTIVFASDVKTAHEMEAAFKAQCVAAVALDSKSEDAFRNDTLRDFEQGRLEVLINVDLFDEGFDVPAVEAVILARVTYSLQKYLQMVGRALRIMNGKSHAIIIDPVLNWERNGMFTWIRNWSLDGRAKGARTNRSDDTISMTRCLTCTQPFESFRKACPYCGALRPQPEGRADLKQVQGDLFELDVEALSGLQDKYREANLPVDAYRAQLQLKHCPAIGVASNVKRHKQLLSERQRLHHLIAWWVGAQRNQQRELAEIHRRFYTRFQIDLLTVFTLSLKETQSFIQRFTQLYGKDLANE